MAAFAAAGFVSRATLRATETRYQIAAFVLAALLLEIVLAMTRLARPSGWRGAANAIAALLVIVSVKFELEPVARTDDAAAVRHVAHRIARRADRL